MPSLTLHPHHQLRWLPTLGRGETLKPGRPARAVGSLPGRPVATAGAIAAPNDCPQPPTLRRGPFRCSFALRRRLPPQGPHRLTSRAWRALLGGPGLAVRSVRLSRGSQRAGGTPMSRQEHQLMTDILVAQLKLLTDRLFRESVRTRRAVARLTQHYFSAFSSGSFSRWIIHSRAHICSNVSFHDHGS